MRRTACDKSESVPTTHVCTSWSWSLNSKVCRHGLSIGVLLFKYSQTERLEFKAYYGIQWKLLSIRWPLKRILKPTCPTCSFQCEVLHVRSIQTMSIVMHSRTKTQPFARNSIHLCSRKRKNSYRRTNERHINRSEPIRMQHVHQTVWVNLMNTNFLSL